MSPALHDGPQSWVIPFPGDLMLSSDFEGTRHTCGAHMYAGTNAHIHNIKI